MLPTIEYTYLNLIYVCSSIVLLMLFIAVLVNLARLPPESLEVKDASVLGKNVIYDSMPIPPKKKVKKKEKKRLNKYEEECRRIFEKLFSEEFPNVRPEWLVNPVTGSLLELDIYCEKLNLACEYDGRQHAEHVDRFHKNSTQFKYQRKKDNFKTKACQIRGVDLVRVPHWVKFKDLESFIVTELTKIGRL